MCICFSSFSYNFFQYFVEQAKRDNHQSQIERKREVKQNEQHTYSKTEEIKYFLMWTKSLRYKNHQIECKRFFSWILFDFLSIIEYNLHVYRHHRATVEKTNIAAEHWIWWWLVSDRQNEQINTKKMFFLLLILLFLLHPFFFLYSYWMYAFISNISCNCVYIAAILCLLFFHTPFFLSSILFCIYFSWFFCAHNAHRFTEVPAFTC